MDFTGAGGSLFLANATFGFSFEVTQPVIVDRLGFFDDFTVDGVGLNHDHLVRIWTDDEDRQLITSATVRNTSAVTSSTAEDGQWFFEDINSVILRRGSYVIGADDPTCSSGDCDRIRYLTTATTMPGISLTTVRNASPPGFPAATTNNRDDGYFGPTFDAQSLPGADFNMDDRVSCLDVDALVGEIVAGTNNASFDMTGDTQVDRNDLIEWLAQAGALNLASGNSYLEGDANLDGTVDGQDFIAWNENKFTETAAWCSGDFNADGTVDGQDFIEWNANKFTSADGMTVSVPEPAFGPCPLAMFVILTLRCRIRAGS